MKLLKLSFLLVLMTFLASCSDDDDSGNCVQADWVGTYAGTVECDGISEDGTITITASGTDAIVIEYETSTVESEFDPLTPNGCDLDKTESSGGLSLSIDASLDGDQFTMKEIIGSGTETFTCNITGTRN